MQTFLLAVSADTAFYEKWKNILENRSTGHDIFRELGWLLVKLVLSICNACEKLLEYANKSLSFIVSPNVSDFINQWKYVIYGVLTIAILCFGINLMVNRKQEKSKLLQNIVIAILVLMCSTTAIIQLTTNTQSFSLELLNNTTSTSAEKVIKDAVTDLYYLDANDFSDASAQQKNVIPASSITNIDITEDIKSSDNVDNPDVFKYKYNSNGKNGQAELEEIDDGGLTDYNNNTYYRFDIDWVTIFMTLLATAVVMVFTAFKVIKLVFDIIVHHILAVLLAAGDWASGQKLKEVVKSLFALFFSVFMCSVMMKLYFMFSAWTSSNISSAAARGFILFFAAFAVIDGPNIIERIFGIDAGLASTFRSVSTLFFATSGALRVAHSAGHAANALVRGTARTAGATGGFWSSVISNRKGHSSGSDAKSGTDGDRNGIANTATNQNKNGEKDSKTGSSPNAKNQQNVSRHNNSNDSDVKSGGSEADKCSASDAASIGKSNQNTDNEGQSISNQASQKTHNNYDYWGQKSRNPRSVTGAAVRGKDAGRYWGDKISDSVANRRERQEAKRNAKGDKK